jgi:hypothetical protein
LDRFLYLVNKWSKYKAVNGIEKTYKGQIYLPSELTVIIPKKQKRIENIAPVNKSQNKGTCLKELSLNSLIT